MTDTAIDERYFQTFYTIMCDICYQIDVLNVKFTISFSFCIYTAEQFYFVFIKVLTDFFYSPDVPEKLSTQITVADNGFFNHA